MNRQQVLATARLAGEVVRYHTWPTHRRQSVGEHTWQVLRIYWQIFGPPSPEVTTDILWHDAPELVTGDPPFPIKACNPALKAEYDRLEPRALADMGGRRGVELTAYERRRIKCCDLLEMHEFGVQELRMGNEYARPIVSDTAAALDKLMEDLSADDLVRLRGYVSRVGEQ